MPSMHTAIVAGGPCVSRTFGNVVAAFAGRSTPGSYASVHTNMCWRTACVRSSSGAGKRWRDFSACTSDWPSGRWSGLTNVFAIRSSCRYRCRSADGTCVGSIMHHASPARSARYSAAHSYARCASRRVAPRPLGPPPSAAAVGIRSGPDPSPEGCPDVPWCWWMTSPPPVPRHVRRPQAFARLEQGRSFWPWWLSLRPRMLLGRVEGERARFPLWISRAFPEHVPRPPEPCRRG